MACRGSRIAFIAAAALLIGGLPCGAQAPVVRVADGAVEGEAAIVDLDGRVIRRFTGLGRPTHISRSGPGRYLVTDGDAGGLLELDLEGSLLWSWEPPAGEPRPMMAHRLPDDRLLVFARPRSVLEVDREGRVAWQATIPFPDPIVRGLARLADGSTVLGIQSAPATLVYFEAGASEGVLVEPPATDHDWRAPGLVAWNGTEADLLMWDRHWGVAHLVRWTANGPVASEALPLPRSLQELAPDGQGGITFSRNRQGYGRWTRVTGSADRDFLYEIAGVAPTTAGDRLLLAFWRTPDASWPDSYDPPERQTDLEGPVLLAWCAAAVLLATLLHLAIRHRRSRDPWIEADTVAAGLRPPRAQHHSPRWLIGAAVFAAGLIVSAFAFADLGLPLNRRRLAVAIAGALAAAAVLELRRRRSPRRPDSFCSELASARPTPSGRSVWLAAVLAVAVGCAFFVAWRRPGSGVGYSHQVGLWLALLIVLAAMTFLDSTPMLGRMRWSRAGAGAVTLALAVAAVTFLWRLTELPALFHGDHVTYSLAGLWVLEGRVPEIWSGMHFEVPSVGLLPEAAGMALAGPELLGFRLGGALFCLSAIPAVYLLGCAWRDRRTGLFAALFIAGSVPFMHFARTNQEGEAATAVLWAVTTFLLAARDPKPRRWVLAGLVCGYCFYLWPAARVGPIVVAVLAAAIALRCPRAALRRWYGPALAALAVLVCMAPFLWFWISHPAAIVPRAHGSSSLIGYHGEWYLQETLSSLGDSMLRAFGWFFASHDGSSQGTLWPACNGFEAALLAIGLALLLVEGVGFNLLLLCYLLVVLLFCGGLMSEPSWFTRLNLSTPVAALLMARAVTGGLDLLRPGSVRMRRLLPAAAVVMVILLSPATNLQRYWRFETGRSKVYRQRNETWIIGSRLHELGSAYRHFVAIGGRWEWTLDFNRRAAWFNGLLPFIWHLEVREIRDLEAGLPLPDDRPASVILQPDRFEDDAALLLRWYPKAEVEELRDYEGNRVAGLVIIPTHPGQT